MCLYACACVCLCVCVCLCMCVLTPIVPDHPFSLLYSSSLMNMGESFICSPGHLGYFQLLLLPKHSRGNKHPHPLEQPFPKDHPRALLRVLRPTTQTLLGTCVLYRVMLALRAPGRICGNRGAAAPGKAKAQTLLAVVNSSPRAGQERDRPIEKNSSVEE